MSTLARNEDDALDALLRGEAEMPAPPAKPATDVEALIAGAEPAAVGMPGAASVVDDPSEPEADQPPRAMGMLGSEQAKAVLNLKAWQEAAFWAECAQLYLRPTSKGGMCSKVEAKGASVIFHIGEPQKPIGWLLLDGATGSLTVQAPSLASGRAIADRELALAMVEAGKKMGWETMTFQGPRAFVEMATRLASEAGMKVVDPKTFEIMQRAQEKLAAAAGGGVGAGSVAEMRGLASKWVLAALVLAVPAAHAANAKLPSTPSQMERPQPANGDAGSVAQLVEAQNAVSAEEQRIARLKREIRDRADYDPVIEKLGPYLGRDY